MTEHRSHDPDPRDLLDAISYLKKEIFMRNTALDRIAQVVAQDATVSDETKREVARIARIGRFGIEDAE